MTFGERLEILIDSLNMKRPEFSQKIGSNKQTIGHIINNKSSPNFATVMQVLDAFPNLNAEWLTRGVGPIWKDKASSNDLNPIQSSEDREWEDMTIREVGELLKKMKKKE